MLPRQKPGGLWRIAQEPKNGAPDVGAGWRNADSQTLNPFNSVQNYAAFSAWVFSDCCPTIRTCAFGHPVDQQIRNKAAQAAFFLETRSISSTDRV